MLSAVLPLVAAAMLSIDTVLASSPEIVPTNGMGVGVGTGPPGDGIMRICVSIPLTTSPCFAAGLPMVMSVARRLTLGKEFVGTRLRYMLDDALANRLIIGHSLFLEGFEPAPQTPMVTAA